MSWIKNLLLQLTAFFVGYFFVDTYPFLHFKFILQFLVSLQSECEFKKTDCAKVIQ
jgi:hypothetical protein